MEGLGEDLLVKIGSELDIQTMCKLLSVSKAMERIFSSPHIWSRIFERIDGDKDPFYRDKM